jgi:hypothetical protein
MTECVSDPKTWIDVAQLAVFMVPVSIFLWRVSQ